MRKAWKANTWDIDRTVERFAAAYRQPSGKRAEAPVKRYADLSRPSALARLGEALARILGLH